jgi:indolepyruvate ferredoxin oxidoreductase
MSAIEREFTASALAEKAANPALGIEDLYLRTKGPVFMNGIQALVRLPMDQRRLDRAAGLDTAGLVSGYRGSPLGAYDQQLWKAQKLLDAEDIVFQPGLNEDLAATALWGAQMHRAFGPVRTDGVFGIWYGKGPGVDRSGDVLRNANVLGTSPLGGVLAVAGDDHAAQSSMFPHQTDGIFQSVGMPVLQPANPREILTLGLAGITLSRFSGLWVGMKTIAEVVECAASFDLPALPTFHTPEGIDRARLNWSPEIRWPEERVELERRLIEERMPAAAAWAQANRLDGVVTESKAGKLCVVTVGKAHGNTMQALADLGALDVDPGIAVYKVAMSWPLQAAPLLEFAQRFDAVLVVEEKRPVVEDQLKVAAFERGLRLPILGKKDLEGRTLLPEVMEFDAAMVARAVARVLPELEGAARALSRSDDTPLPGFAPRKPFFCAGCPHNRSTKTPDGSVTGGGIGCHVMALSIPERNTPTFSQMGGEGLQWTGAAPFSKTKHAFQNLGDGTYQHSGVLAIRAAISSGANITFKVLYNDAVAMTGGQPAEGAIDPARVTRQLDAEGVAEIWLVSDAPDRWRGHQDLAAKVQVRHRDELPEVERHLRGVPGVTAIVYEQTCAAEKRRRRKRGTMPTPDRRLFINTRVCEGCGDCSVQSNCIAVEPVETEFGRKRRINQSGCNQDFSCLQGFCPSFVEIEGAELRKPDRTRIEALEQRLLSDLAAPKIVPLSGERNLFIAGIGGLGVLTLGALVGAAAHHDGLGATVLDFTGLAQKNGAVVSQVRIGGRPGAIRDPRIAEAACDLLLATDVVVGASRDALARLDPRRTRAIVNEDVLPTADFVSDRDATVDAVGMIDAIRSACRETHTTDATTVCEALFGTSTTANVYLLGHAWQLGLVPISREALQAAIHANGAAVTMNLRAFEWGRLAALDPEAVRKAAGGHAEAPAETLGGLIARRAADLTDYQDAAYAARYEALVGRVRAAAAPFGERGTKLVRAVAENAYRLMAYKDEYEVARLTTSAAFRSDLDAQFANAPRLRFHFSPPMLARKDPVTGRPRKMALSGWWLLPALRAMAKGKRLRGTWADPLGRTAERRRERALVECYFSDMDAALAGLSADNLDRVLTLAELPRIVAGYGPVKETAMDRFDHERLLAVASLQAVPPITGKAA